MEQVKEKTVKNEKPTWWKPGIKAGSASCLCCGGLTVEVLALKTKLYNSSAGGWSVTKGGQPFFCDQRDVEFEEYYDVEHIESLIGEDPDTEYLAHVYLPLRSATYQRHSKNNWVLIENGEGYA